MTLQEYHTNWLKNYFSEGISIAASRKIPRTVGIIPARNMKRDELERILAKDSFRCRLQHN
ncbi:hypothetical protein [Sodalis-like endosymbiont of Proechinophthirus fluctus]|uniref:hypothetical protein n=1 Tax=Sodalis-like endosymbiont of Proechinophthirus fluctus TaxID=1462730 RepID=UPI000AF16E87|nr:hypothetical protein [Sodalis-like endosymbiont of Proechinophthirus fluctus]